MYDYNCMTFWNRQNYGDIKDISDCPGVPGGKDEYRGFLGQLRLFSVMDIWHYKFVQTHGIHNTKSET